MEAARPSFTTDTAPPARVPACRREGKLPTASEAGSARAPTAPPGPAACGPRLCWEPARDPRATGLGDQPS